MSVAGLDKKFVSLTTQVVPYNELQDLYTQLLGAHKMALSETEELHVTAQRRQEAYLRKESQYRQQLKNMEERMQTIDVADPENNMRMNQIRNMHRDIQESIGQIQGKTSRILQDQERDLIRAFRARLVDVTDELDKERKKNENGSVEWLHRCRKLTEQLEWLRELTEKLTQENKKCIKENRSFKRQLKTQEEDREFLIKQLVVVKRENARLRHQFENKGAGVSDGGNASSSNSLPLLTMAASSNPDLRAVDEGSFPSLKQAPGAVTARLQQGGNQELDNESRYRHIIMRLKKQLEAESAKCRLLKTAHTQELASRSQLQEFLKKCIEDVRVDIAQRQKQRRKMGPGGRTAELAGRMAGPPKAIDPRTIPLDEFTAEDRINVMEWLMSQDHVIFMLYEKIFPTQKVTDGSAASLATAAFASSDKTEEEEEDEEGGSGGGTMNYSPSSLADEVDVEDEDGNTEGDNDEE